MAKELKIVPKHFKNELIESMEFMVGKSVCDFIKIALGKRMMCVAIAHEGTWSCGHLPLTQ